MLLFVYYTALKKSINTMQNSNTSTLNFGIDPKIYIFSFISLQLVSNLFYFDTNEYNLSNISIPNYVFCVVELLYIIFMLFYSSTKSSISHVVFLQFLHLVSLVTLQTYTTLLLQFDIIAIFANLMSALLFYEYFQAKHKIKYFILGVVFGIFLYHISANEADYINIQKQLQHWCIAQIFTSSVLLYYFVNIVQQEQNITLLNNAFVNNALKKTLAHTTTINRIAADMAALIEHLDTKQNVQKANELCRTIATLSMRNCLLVDMASTVKADSHPTDTISSIRECVLESVKRYGSLNSGITTDLDYEILFQGPSQLMMHAISHILLCSEKFDLINITTTPNQLIISSTNIKSSWSCNSILQDASILFAHKVISSAEAKLEIKMYPNGITYHIIFTSPFHQTT